jgi:hypothetical protein
MRYRGRHRAGKYSLRVADIKAALHAERSRNDALYHGPVTVPDIYSYLEGAA